MGDKSGATQRCDACGSPLRPCKCERAAAKPKKFSSLGPPRRRAAEERAKFEREFGSEERRAWVGELPCCACGKRPTPERPSENHHCWTDGMGLKATFEAIVPLCWKCHRRYHQIGKLAMLQACVPLRIILPRPFKVGPGRRLGAEFWQWEDAAAFVEAAWQSHLNGGLAQPAGVIYVGPCEHQSQPEASMAHELDFNADTGRHSMISRIETPWHRLGIVFDPTKAGEMDLDSALRLAGLDWKVRKQQNFIWDEIAGVHKPADDSFSIVRQDRMEAIGAVGNAYHPLQNEDAFGVLRPVLDSGVARIETAGSLRNGRQVWLLARFDVETILKLAIEAGGDERLLELLVNETLPYGLFTNDHTGGARARIKETAIRVVCANTFSMAMDAKEEGTSVEVTHGKNVAENYKAAAQLMLKGVAERFAKLAQARVIMQETVLRDYRGWGERPFQRLVLDQVAPVAHLEAKIQRRDDNPRTRTALEKANRVRQEVRDLWDAGKGHTGNGSAWEAFQGAVEWIDHSESAVKAKEGKDEARAESLWGGHLASTKSRIARNLFAYAAADDAGKEALVFGK